jgi:hypothetical protein
MDLATAALIFATQLMDKTTNPGLEYDRLTMAATVAGIVKVTSDPQQVETLIKIARWESGGFRRDVASCKVKGDNGMAMGLFQVHPISRQEALDLCSDDYSKQAAVALAHVNDSVRYCKMAGYSGSNLLTIYTHGHCHRSKDNVAWLRWGDGKAIQKIIDTAPREEVVME